MANDVTMTEAARRLGVSLVKVRSLVREGILPVRANPLDKREKLVPLAAVEELALQGQPASTPQRRQSTSEETRKLDNYQPVVE